MTEQEFIDKAAIAAMQGIIIRNNNLYLKFQGEEEREKEYEESAKEAYQIAWAMLKARRTGGTCY